MINNKEILTLLILSALEDSIKASKDVMVISNNISELKNKLEIEENKILAEKQEKNNLKKSDDIYNFNNFYDYTIYLNNLYNLRKRSIKYKQMLK
jgi:hypothetical protein